MPTFLNDVAIIQLIMEFNNNFEKYHPVFGKKPLKFFLDTLYVYIIYFKSQIKKNRPSVDSPKKKTSKVVEELTISVSDNHRNVI